MTKRSDTNMGEIEAPLTPPREAPLVTAEALEELKAQAAKAQDHWDQLLRTAADFDNYRKRAARERQEATRQSVDSMLQKLIPVLDNFDMAMSAAQGADHATVQSIQTGMNMIYSQLKSVLADAGLEEIEARGKPFDPSWHEAVAQEETLEVPEGQVVQQHRKGYKTRDRLLRPATVVVATKPAK